MFSAKSTPVQSFPIPDEAADRLAETTLRRLDRRLVPASLRSTFYAHFTGKDHLKRSGLDDHLRGMLLEHQRAATLRPLDGGFGFVLPFLEHARGHLELYRALASKGGVTTTTAMLREIVTELVRNELAHRPAPGGLRPEVVTAFVVGGFMSLLTWWLNGGARLAPAELDVMFRRLVLQGLGDGGGDGGGAQAV